MSAPAELSLAVEITSVDGPADPPDGFRFVETPFEVSVAAEAVSLDVPLTLTYASTDAAGMSAVWWDGAATRRDPVRMLSEIRRLLAPQALEGVATVGIVYWFVLRPRMP